PMKTSLRPEHVAASRRGAALMLSFMVLLVLILILAQIKVSTDTAARVARNEETLASMESAIESSMLQVFEDLKTDAQSGGSGSGADGLGGSTPSSDGKGSSTSGSSGTGMGGGASGDGAGGGQDSGPTDSKEDSWAHPQRTEVNEIQLRILIQDEDSK